ncbi:type I polyketide synthase [Rouxiella chamberiensis]|uniref:Beta-ketoacyl synthase N-terminal-like domain-containing protein n=1 Tax=Rouxiella chamberiensis TaxID=1513468 RepID=A0ABY7HUN1_9GAMM|nr:beta-ketoacyl synthase N-terminal-like domain-containing protein [Rouxiella chamberiensis]WAT02516.1 beta-ketoacyl synthase N-terminal-like domain-containing protein [Rouxiella chamberiensis]
MDIAIIGVSCRLPDADNYSEFWGNIVNHRNSVVKISSAEQGEFSLPRATLKWPAEHENRFAALINRIDGFDNQFFGIIPKVAETMDPQQRIMLENTWTCLEDAGIPPSSLRGKKVGVIIGVFNNDYKELQENTDNPIEAHHSTGTATSIIANRISHFFDFHGPSLALDTACSSSLNAIHAAVQAIRNGDCEIALSGGVNLILTSTRHQSFAKMGMLSPSGACHSFDDQADGYVRGEGAAVLLLKPLDKALADGDTVHGVIKGSAVNHCGNSYTLTYPSADAQADVIIAAHRQAGVPINSIGLIEAHGTGTPKGDPIEFAGLKQAFSALAQQQDIALEDGFCGVTSVKSNIGHLEAAAGVAGVIKVLQAFRHRQLPPLRHFSAINPKIDLQQSPFFFVDQTTAWPRIDDATPRRAGVSSFGFGGTNAHVVLEEAPEPLRRRTRKKSRPTSGSASLIALSAKSPEALLQRQMQLIQWLQAHPDASLDAVSATLLTRRDHFPYRFGCVGHEVQSLVATLETAVAQGLLVMQAHEDAEAEEAGMQARALLEHLARAKSPASESQLAQLADCYQRGARFEGSALFANTDVKAVSLPTYPFIHQSFWITPRRRFSRRPASSGAECGQHTLSGGAASRRILCCGSSHGRSGYFAGCDVSRAGARSLYRFDTYP